MAKITKTLYESSDDTFVDVIAAITTTMTTKDLVLSKLTYRFPYYFWNCFFQSFTVCS